MGCKIEENAEISLHDCKADRILPGERELTFFFPDGFFRLDEGNVTKTGAGEMRCRLMEPFKYSFSAFLYRKDLFGRTVRKDISDRFVSAVNSGKFSFEVVSAYRAYQFLLLKGCVWFDRKPYQRECEIELHTDKITYNWTDAPRR